MKNILLFLYNFIYLLVLNLNGFYANVLGPILFRAALPIYPIHEPKNKLPPQISR